MQPLEFQDSEPLTLGVELELQIVNTRNYDLARGAVDLLALAQKTPFADQVKPEITESMIELNSSVHGRPADLLQELQQIRDSLARSANRLNLGIAGGGTHPFHKWAERRIYPTERFLHVSDLYGYLAKQFTVFGQHIHIGCRSGDEAIYLIHALSRYMPHFIALSASSPFSQGEDTAFDSSRLNSVRAFPLSGYPPFLESWQAFNAYFAKMREFGIVESMKDFYWDIRPKPEYGTVEIRVCDTPLCVEHAAALAAYAQALAHYLTAEKPVRLSPDTALPYSYNYFQACRFGLNASFINPYTRQRVPLQQDILETLDAIEPFAQELGGAETIAHLMHGTIERHNDATWLRNTLQKTGSLHDVVRLQCDYWAQGAQ